MLQAETKAFLINSVIYLMEAFLGHPSSKPVQYWQAGRREEWGEQVGAGDPGWQTLLPKERPHFPGNPESSPKAPESWAVTNPAPSQGLGCTGVGRERGSHSLPEASLDFIIAALKICQRL